MRKAQSHVFYTARGRRSLLTLVVMLCCAFATHAEDAHTTYTFTLKRTADQTASTTCTIRDNVALSVLSATSSGSVEQALDDEVLKLWAIQYTSGKYYGTTTYGTLGWMFNAKGVVVSSTSKAVVYAQFDAEASAFKVRTDTDAVSEGDTIVFQEAFVNSSTADTLVYQFNVIITADTQSVSSDEPAYIHRADLMDALLARPYVQCNDEEGEYTYYLQVNEGDKVTFGMRVYDEDDVARFSIKNSSGTTLKYTNANDFVIESATTADAGYYTVTARITPAGGTFTNQTFFFVLDVQTDAGANYDWTANTPYWSYDFRDEYPDGFDAPTQVLNPYGSLLEGYMADGWWCVQWGANRRTIIQDTALVLMLDKFNEDFAYIRDEMGWPPDKRARNGYYSTVVYYGSGLSDGADTTALGGWQGSDYYNGESWPNVLASYYPIYCFDPSCTYSDAESQQEAMIHEGIHAVFADMDGVKNAAWFHEGGNTWLQSAMATKRTGEYGTPGFLDACPFIAPFMPIECYSGWLQDGSFGGPSAEGVNMYNDEGTQLCTWKNLLGGTQYGNGFAIFLGEAIGQGSIPWIWRYCTSRVLEGIAEGNSSEGVEGIGEDSIRSLILQYRAKQATFDIGGWATGYRSVVDDYFGVTVEEEYEPYWIDCDPYILTPYVEPTLNDDEGWLAPDTITNPGWSGANIVPIHVSGLGCKVYFRPEDTQMRAQLCYRTKSGDCYYSQPALCGELSLSWTTSNAPANAVVFLVVANTDYLYEGEETRTKHYDYRIKLGDGANAVADKDIRWYFYEKTLTDTAYETAISEVTADAAQDEDDATIRIVSSTLRSGAQVQLDLDGIPASEVKAHLVGISGVVINEQQVSEQGTIDLPTNLRRGLYVLSLSYNGRSYSQKMFVQ